MITRTLLLPTLLCTSLSAYSLDTLNGCIDFEESDKKTAVYFANDILTDPDDADDMAIRMRIAYKTQFESLHENSTYDFLKAYNYSDGALTDITQAIQQEMDEEEADGVSGYQIYQLISSGLNHDAIRAVLEVYITPSSLAIFTDDFIESLGSSMTQATVESIADRLIVKSQHVSLYEADLLSGKRVIILPHSQGNLFTNDAVASVKSRQPDRAGSIDYFGVANPAALTVNNASYVTADDDRVISGLSLIEDVLPSNLDNAPAIVGDFRTISNHLFAEDYFDNRLASRGVIDTNLTRIATDTPFPIQIAGTGAIRASLSWGTEPDVDLHVYEPDRGHIFYSNKTGLYGTIDVDDRDGEGPENYTVACDNVAPGSYRIGVNYYDGLAPETAKVIVFLGDGRTITPREVFLEYPEGRFGNSHPSWLFDITVTSDRDGNAIYTVE